MYIEKLCVYVCTGIVREIINIVDSGVACALCAGQRELKVQSDTTPRWCR